MTTHLLPRPPVTGIVSTMQSREGGAGQERWGDEASGYWLGDMEAGGAGRVR